jgi:AraC-like DNA-binding protein
LQSMAIFVERLPAALPDLRAVRWSTDAPYVAVKELYAIGRVEEGQAEWWGSGKLWRSTPGTVQLKRPGDVHRDSARQGSITLQVVTFPSDVVERALGKVHLEPQLAADDARGVPFQRLHDAVRFHAERLALEVAVTEALSALAQLGDARSTHTRPVRRALELLRARFTETITLSDLAVHAGLDKYHLCRDFRAQVGLPPHAYQTRLRVMRAKQLLAAGIRPSEVAAHSGFYDQSQLTHHFRRIVGTTPGRYLREV